ncbi:Na+/H+ antiporter subunit C [Qingshengfaniella alkalisoli]|uniref:Na+/H+ antiporter subunit C n=1 Tax=Qingshengfaniella alkalisoli TaxID=2599296 RepID=A0A5B8J6L2_9RHOB|nr:Na+/H+ antiporter subunit C [Qingshengfaniella alkalisoli]QDY70077.1 Na+/H+ antiporter subunit C [Qingshengfaniella alkalisoli]
MEAVLAITIGALFAASVYLMLDRNLMRFLFGLTLITNAVNLSIFSVGRLKSNIPPLIPEGERAPIEPVANALPQALVLTAIVIGFGLFAFALILTLRAYTSFGTLQTDEIRLAEPRKDDA